MRALQNFRHVTVCLFTVVQRHDENSEGLPRRLCVKMVKRVAGNISLKTAGNTWDRTIKPYGIKQGLITNYVKAQAGTSKRTTAGNVELQTRWQGTVDDVFRRVYERAMEVLKDKELVLKLMVFLINNLDEECLHAIGQNERIVGSKRNKKHNNQNHSSRYAYSQANRYYFIFRNGNS